MGGNTPSSNQQSHDHQQSHGALQSDQQPNFIIGTAGHVDHGKSALVKALTGTDPDRLAEEKQRGLTIELGFAELKLADGRTMGIVDVPGHERFVRQMISGATGIDIALLVIAADDGIMPQTVEHLAILQTLHIPTCVVALTKTDLVDATRIAQVTDDIARFLAATPFAGAAIVPTSSLTGRGLPELIDALTQAAEGRTSSNRSCDFARLPIDRVFTIRGAGTVVTGSLWSGQVAIGDKVEVLPAKTVSRVRSIQVHGRPVQHAEPGMRVALNLSSVSTDDIHPGDFVAEPGRLEASSTFDAQLTFRDTSGNRRPLINGTRVHIAHGTKEIPGRVLFLGGIKELASDNSTLVQIRLDEPLPVRRSDRFVMRTWSPRYVCGGGCVLLSRARHRTGSNVDGNLIRTLEALANNDIATATQAFLAYRSLPLRADAVASELDLSPAETTTHLEAACADGAACKLQADGCVAFISRASLDGQLRSIEQTLAAHAAAHPDAPLADKDSLRRLSLPKTSPEAFMLLLAEAAARGAVVVSPEGACLPAAQSTADHRTDETADRICQMLCDYGATPPAISEMASHAHISEAALRHTLGKLEKDGRANRISSEFFLDADTYAQCRDAIIAYLEKNGSGAAGELGKAMGISRKYAIPILEHFDRIGLTMRTDDGRTLKKPRQ